MMKVKKSISTKLSKSSFKWSLRKDLCANHELEDFVLINYSPYPKYHMLP